MEEYKIKRDWHLDLVPDKIIVNYLKYVIDYTETQLNWYKNSQVKKRTISLILLVFAFIGFGLSLLFPLVPGLKLGAIDTIDFGYWYAAGYICLIVTSIVLLLDRLFGHSDGWIRYMMTELQIEKALSEHHSQWIKSLQLIDLSNITKEEKANLVELIEKLDISIKDIVKVETENWREVFSNQLREFQTKTDSRLDSAKNDLKEFKEKMNATHTGKIVLKVQIEKPKNTKAIVQLENNGLKKNSEVMDSQRIAIFKGLSEGVYEIEFKIINISDGKIINEERDVISINQDDFPIKETLFKFDNI